MYRKLAVLLLFVVGVGSGGVVWGASGGESQFQGFDITISVTASIGKEGFSPSDSSVSANVSTVLRGVNLSSSTTLSLAFALLEEKIVASGKIGDYNVTDEVTFDLKNPIQKKLTIATKLGSWDLSSVTAMSIAMDLSKFELMGETIKVGTTTKDGLKLSSATTLTLAGLTKEALSVGGTIAGLSLKQTTEIGTKGLAKSTWQMNTAIEGINLSRTTVYTGEGFSSDSLTVSGTVEKYDLSCTASFGKTGWSGLDLDASTKFDRFDLSSSLSLTAEGFSGASLTASTTFEGVGAPPKKEEPKPEK